MDDLKAEFLERFNRQKEYLPSKSMESEKMPLVSIVVSVYNHEKFLERCLNSLLSQVASFPFEILVGEDNSVDRSRALCIEYAEKYPETIRLFLRERAESIIQVPGQDYKRYLNGVFNLKSARGTFIAFCEGDDFWLEQNKLQMQINAILQNEGCDLCFHRGVAIDAETEEVIGDESNFGKIEKIVSSEDVVERGGGGVLTSSIVIRSTILDEYFDLMFLGISGDFLIQIISSFRGGAVYLPAILSVYRKNNSQSFTGQWKNLEYRLKHRLRTEEGINFLISQKYIRLKKPFSKHLAIEFMHDSFKFLKAFQFRIAAACIKRSVQYAMLPQPKQWILLLLLLGVQPFALNSFKKYA